MIRVEPDRWLSDVLETPSWKVAGIAASTPVSELRAQLEQHGKSAAFFTAKILTTETQAVANAARVGFRVVDVNMTFDWAPPAETPGAGRAAAATFGTAGGDDAVAIENIAAGCFRYTRFHLDDAIGLDRANEIKRQWARNACRGRAATVYVARLAGSVVGFLAVLESRSLNGSDAIIDLVGVDAAHQGQGIGRGLSHMFVEAWRGRADRLRVGTQVSNVPAMRLYEKMGFRIAESAYVLHAHVKDGVIVK